MSGTQQPEALRQKTSSMNERYTLTDGYMEFAPDEGECVNQRPIVSRCQRPNFSSCSG